MRCIALPCPSVGLAANLFPSACRAFGSFPLCRNVAAWRLRFGCAGRGTPRATRFANFVYSLGGWGFRLCHACRFALQNGTFCSAGWSVSPCRTAVFARPNGSVVYVADCQADGRGVASFGRSGFGRYVLFTKKIRRQLRLLAFRNCMGEGSSPEQFVSGLEATS